MAVERALDHAAALLRVRADWSRGSSVPYEASASVHASEADGDGPSRLLATFFTSELALDKASEGNSEDDFPGSTKADGEQLRFRSE